MTRPRSGARLERARADAVAVLRQALPASMRAELPARELGEACTRLRAELFGGRSPWNAIRRGAGFVRPLPADDRELWLRSAGALVSPRDSTGLGVEDEAMLNSLGVADWLGTIIGLARAGAGTSAEPLDLVEYLCDCPEIFGAADIDYDEADVRERAFELVLPVWEALAAVDAGQRLTRLGAWGLPHALARALGHPLDEGEP